VIPQILAISRNGSYEREARFYQRFGTRPAATPAIVHSHKVPIRTPEIYFCEYDPEAARLCILMQDVSSYEPLDQLKGASFDEALGVMQDIGRFHVSVNTLERKGMLFDEALGVMQDTRRVNLLGVFLQEVEGMISKEEGRVLGVMRVVSGFQKKG
jgi:hypothetical protein